MSHRPNHLAAGIGFVIACVIIACVLYAAFVGDRASIRNAAGDPPLDNTMLTDVASADVERSGNPPPQPLSSSEQVRQSAPDEEDSLCLGYWLAEENWAVHVAREGTVSLYRRGQPTLSQHWDSVGLQEVAVSYSGSYIRLHLDCGSRASSGAWAADDDDREYYQVDRDDFLSKVGDWPEVSHP